MTVTGAAFADPEVVALYDLRAPYPEAAFDLIAGLVPVRAHALDIGCGTGKGTRPLAARFGQVTALDPSQAMIGVAQKGAPPNVRWMCGKAEDLDLPKGIDLAFFGESIHWIDESVLFPRLAQSLNLDHCIAVLTGGDAPVSPDWQAVWDGFLVDWVPVTTGTEYQPGRYRDISSRYRDWLTDLAEAHVESDPIRQSLSDYIRMVHSRASFTAERLGPRLAEFDRDLTDRLAPFADDGGNLTYATRTKITSGRLTTGGRNETC